MITLRRRMSLGLLLLVVLAGLIASPRCAAAPPAIPEAANVPGVSAALSASPPYTCVTNFYVDGVNGNDAASGTLAAPWKTIQNADNWSNHVPAAGECVNVLPGSYTLTKTLVLHTGGARAAANGYVVYRSTEPRGAHLIASADFAKTADLIQLWTGYIIIDGFEVDGNHAVTSGHGIDGCVNGGGPGNIAHHFIAINNIIHDMGASGLNTCSADFILWRNNVVYNTSSSSPYQVSGIDVWQPKVLAPDSYTRTEWDNGPFGIQISYNIVHDNAEGPAVAAKHTDGNGIIIDVTLGSAQCPNCGTPYPGNILVLGNVAYRNGGGGIHLFLSQNVTVANNTVFNNHLDTANPATARGELSNLGSRNITWINNIAIAVPGSGVLSANAPIVSLPLGNGFDASGATWMKNVAFGADIHVVPAPAVSGNTDLIDVDPQLADPAHGDFRPRRGSPVIGAGAAAAFLPPGTRNIGAY
jgi:parallel beta-helix repeat protein